MAKKMWAQIIIYGFLLYVVFNVLLFILSLVTKSESTEYPPEKYFWVAIVIAILVAVCSWWFSRRIGISTTKEGLAYGLGWAAVIIVLLIIVTIPNQTFGKIFGEWSSYLIFVGAVVGPLLRKPRSTV